MADHDGDVVVLRLDAAAAAGETAMYQKFWNEMPGEVLEWVSAKSTGAFGALAVHDDARQGCLMGKL